MHRPYSATGPFLKNKLLLYFVLDWHLSTLTDFVYQLVDYEVTPASLLRISQFIFFALVAL